MADDSAVGTPGTEAFSATRVTLSGFVLAPISQKASLGGIAIVPDLDVIVEQVAGVLVIPDHRELLQFFRPGIQLLSYSFTILSTSEFLGSRVISSV